MPYERIDFVQVKEHEKIDEEAKEGKREEQFAVHKEFYNSMTGCRPR
ncbi:MAG: hypothetical protein ACLT4D_16305 [Blautia faecis]